jgi:hypothetical protein
MSIRERLREFINDPSHTAMVLGGGWGEGKTYFWQRFASDHAKEGKVHRPNYAYVSLFGVNSLAELRNALAVRIHSVDHMDRLTFMELMDADVAQAGGRLKRALAELFSGPSSKGAGISVPHASFSNIAPLYMAWAYHGVRNALICVDDIERRGKGLDLKDVLGLIADLVNERKCSVIAILNDGALAGDELKAWNDSREKVFMGELRWYGTCDTSLGYVYNLSMTDEDERMAIDAIKELDIANIRIIQRIQMAIGQVLPKLSMPMLLPTRREIIRGLAIITYARSGQGCGAPPVAMLRKSQLVRDAAIEAARQNGKKLDKTPQELAWEALFRRYGYHIDGQLDELLDKSVGDGYPDLVPLELAVRTFDAQARKNTQHQAMQDAWDLYHEKVGDNAAEVIAAVYRAYLDCATDLAAPQADASIGLIRDLGDPVKADIMADTWIAARSLERWVELSPENVAIFGGISDASFVQKINHAYENALTSQMPDFATMMESVRKGSGYSNTIIEGLGAASVATYIDYFRAQGLDAAKTLLSLPPSGLTALQQVREKTLEALATIARESVIDRRRVRTQVGDVEALLANYPDIAHD